MNSDALLFGVVLISIGALILAKTWDVPPNEMTRRRVRDHHKRVFYLKWIGLGLIIVGVIFVVAAFDLTSP